MNLLTSLAVSALVGAPVICQTGRNMHILAPALIGQTCAIAMSHPTAASGNLFAVLVSAPFPSAVTVIVPTHSVVGQARVDPGAAISVMISSLNGTGLSPAWQLPIPNSIGFVGLRFDVQGADYDPGTRTATFADNDITVAVGSPNWPSPALNMVMVPAGSFMMGSTAVGGSAVPVHQVSLSRYFWIGQHEVTQSEYQAIAGANPSYNQAGGSYPVEQVTWPAAMAFCAALNAQEVAAGRVPAGYQYRLPTEAEWEYCCRAGTTTEWSTGAFLFCWQARYGGIGSGCSGSNSPATVGSYPPNAWGLHDMHGNVFELCLDRLDQNQGYPNGPVTDPYQANGDFGSARGGAWDNGQDACRSAFRFRVGYGTSWQSGLRVALAPTQVTYATAGPTTLFDMLPISAGSFVMGSTAVGGNAMPVHNVTLTRPFWMSKYEITEAQYYTVIGSTQQGSTNPIQATWIDCMQFCRELTVQEAQAGRLPAGYQYRLPTEAEWEYSCRAGTTTDWNVGSSLACAHANIQGCLGHVAPVGSFSPNPWGLHDMHGNVAELCLDRLAPYTSGAAVDPWSGAGSVPVTRGGDWTDGADVCRSAARNTTGGGLRVVLAPWVTE